MTHFHMHATTDPMTGRDIPDTAGRPYVVEGEHYHDLTIYFESDVTRKAYLDIPVEKVGGEGNLHRMLDNPAADMNDNN